MLGRQAVHGQGQGGACVCGAMQELKRVAGEELNQCEVDLDAEAREDDELRLVVGGVS